MSDANQHTTGETTPGEDEQWEDQKSDIVRKIGLEEFQPKGTLTLVLLYFVIILLMWLFMYFVEFAGNAPSILN